MPLYLKTKEIMTDKEVTLKNLETEKKELKEELEFRGGINSRIESEISEIDDTIKKLKTNSEPKIYEEYLTNDNKTIL